MADNEASIAGMDEIKGHVGVLTARLKQLTAGGNETKAVDALEDISDYYERAVQLRTYRITSLEEELKESQDKIKQTQRMAGRARISMWIYTFIVFGIVFSLLFPEETSNLIESESTWSHLIVGLITAFVVYLFKK